MNTAEGKVESLCKRVTDAMIAYDVLEWIERGASPCVNREKNGKLVVSFAAISEGVMMSARLFMAQKWGAVQRWLSMDESDADVCMIADNFFPTIECREHYVPAIYKEIVALEIGALELMRGDVRRALMLENVCAGWHAIPLLK